MCLYTYFNRISDSVLQTREKLKPNKKIVSTSIKNTRTRFQPLTTLQHEKFFQELRTAVCTQSLFYKFYNISSKVACLAN